MKNSSNYVVINGFFSVHLEEFKKGNESEMMIAICQERNYIKLCLLFYVAKLSHFPVPLHRHRVRATVKKKSLNWPQQIESEVFKVFIVATFSNIHTHTMDPLWAKHSRLSKHFSLRFQHTLNERRLFF
jgi:hypothetical protein